MESKTAWIFLADGFEEIEAFSVVDILRRANIHVRTLSIYPDRKQVIGAHQTEIVADESLAELSADATHPDMIILPGGMPGTQNLTESQRVLDWVSSQNQSQRGLAAICAAPWVLAAAGIDTPEIKVTCYPGFEEKLGNFKHLAASLIESRHITTAQGPAYAFDFALSIVESLQGVDTAKQVSAGLLYED